VNSSPLPSPAPGQKRILELDGLRAVCISLVTIYHLWRFTGVVSAPAAWGWLFNYAGPLGVKLFFIISGFIITRLMLEEVKKAGTFSIRDFFIKRIFRILPVYWIYLLVVTVLAGLGLLYLNPWNVIYCLLFTSNIWLIDPSFFYFHTWSLSVEEQYYVLFPLFVGLLIRRGSRITSIIMVLIYMFALFSPNIGKVLHLRFHVLDIGFLTNFRYIIAGVLLTLWWEPFSLYVTRMNWLLPLGGLVVLLGTVCLLSHFSDQLLLLKYGFMLMEPLLLALLIGWVLCQPAHFGVLRLAPVQWLGRTSYSLYIWQPLFIGDPLALFKFVHPNFITAVAPMLLCASLSYYLIERPFNAWGRRFVRKTQNRIVPPEVAVAAASG
jgi:peptidoglycan/LPS O-acetylase OafA/YrhL